MNKNIIIDFSSLGGPLYSGRDRGEEARVNFDLDILDQEDVVIDVEIPDKTYSVTSSFFLGFFGNSIRACGDIDCFFNKFRFKAPNRMIEKFSGYAKRALREKKPLISN